MKGGAVKEGQVKNVSVVTPQKMLKGIINILFVVGIYPCAKGHVYKNNPTTNAIERRVGAYFGGNFCVLFIDAVLFSANKKRINTKTFNPQKMLETLGANPALIKELFSRLCNQLRTWWLQGCAEVYKFPVCAIAGKDVERYAYEKWKEKNLIEEKERICHLDGLTVVLCWVRLGELGKEEEEEEDEKRREEKRRVLFILGGDHPSAHLRRDPEQVERFDRVCLLKAAAMDFSMEVAKMTTEDCSLSDMFSNCLKKCNKEYWETRKARLKGLKETLDSVGILEDVAANYDSLGEENDEVYLKDSHLCLRHAQFEDDEVCENVKTFVNTFGKKLAVKFFANGSFVCGLCQKETFEVFTGRLGRVLGDVFGGDIDLFSKVCFGTFFAALADEKDGVAFIKRIIDIIDNYFDGDCNLFATNCCNSLFAALNSEEKAGKVRERIDTLIRDCFGKDKGLFRQACCGSLFAGLADEKDGVAFILRIKKIIVDYFDGDRGLFATKCCDGLFAALNSEEKAGKLRERIDLLIGDDDDGDKDLYGDNKTFMAAASGDSFYAGLSSDEGDKYVKFLLVIKEKFYKTNPVRFAMACSWNPMCALLSAKSEDGELTGGLISDLEQIQEELFPDSDLTRMTQELWRKFSKEKRETNLTDAEKEKRSKTAVRAFIDSNIDRLKCQIDRKWDDNEIDLLMWLVDNYGTIWTDIAKCFKLRTAKACEAKYYKELRKRARKWEKEMEQEKENEDGDDESKENHHFIKEEYKDEDKRQRGERVPLQQLNK